MEVSMPKKFPSEWTPPVVIPSKARNLLFRRPKEKADSSRKSRASE
jgi:hypothetical protein